jgi:short-subunit dehydrogenase
MNARLQTPSNIWITGASSGIGKAVAEILAGQGHQLIVTGRRESHLEELRSRAPGHIIPAPADVTNKESLRNVARVLESQGPLDMAILNAGTCEYLDVARYQSDVIEKNLHTNVTGTARCLDIALPALRHTRSKGRPATLVIVSSSAWWFPFARAEGYGASKAALSYLGLSLRADLASEGIDVVLVSPGFVKTPLTDQNDFPMPFLVSVENAANRIVTGLSKGHNTIAFPKRFTWLLRLMSALPQPAIDRIAAGMARKSTEHKDSTE